ncbi:hypothetical protein [Streptomyces decoyicus]|uniref:hypothetical protein n=1 Tax=Streptomyces decoyicus TaxID=249567 RepID=UPI00364F6084
MEAAESLASAAVQILTGMATGAATSAGTGLGQAVGELVRSRLGGSEQGRVALAGVDADPADPGATQRLEAALREALLADPEFTTSLEAALADGHPPAPPANITESIVIGNSRIRSSQISLGPLTISHTHTTRSSLVMMVVALVAVLALGLYGGVRLITGDAPDRAEHARKGHPTSVPTSLDTESLVAKILPDRGSLPPGWAVASGPSFEERMVCTFCKSDGEVHSFGVVGWELPGSREARFYVDAYSNPAAAAADYASHSSEFKVVPVGKSSYFSRPYVANEDQKVLSLDEGGSPAVQAVIRMDRVVIRIRMSADWARQQGHLSAFAYMMSSRAEQALDGNTVRSKVPSIV